MCRLCFEKKSKSIGIFTTKGIRLNVANTVRAHFPDEVNRINGFDSFVIEFDFRIGFVLQVSKEDILPKFVCTECWTKATTFHKFYEAVAGAKIIYLERSLEEELRPNFAEINCDAVALDDGIACVKMEPSIDIGAGQLELTEHNSGAVNASQCRSDTNSRSTSFFQFANDDGSNDSDKCMAKFGKARHPKVDEATALAAIRNSFNIEHTQTHGASANPINAPNKEFDHLISKFMDMQCELCRQPFGTLSQASSHYRSKHQRRTATLKCCQRRIKMPDIRDHIQHHLNPNLFK